MAESTGTCPVKSRKQLSHNFNDKLKRPSAASISRNLRTTSSDTQPYYIIYIYYNTTILYYDREKDIAKVYEDEVCLPLYSESGEDKNMNE